MTTDRVDAGHDEQKDDKNKKRMAAAAVHCIGWCLALTLKSMGACVRDRVGRNTNWPPEALQQAVGVSGNALAKCTQQQPATGGPGPKLLTPHF